MACLQMLSPQSLHALCTTAIESSVLPVDTLAALVSSTPYKLVAESSLAFLSLCPQTPPALANLLALNRKEKENG
ncbi:hypothetical protein H310_13914 [Aphanomyces invadans]|uniref:Uncharacterized protein n=1 Tax=Aphanomyces invadans TaxID=157072 RepID=A0A024TDX5_9STRA|nr:hypothetical protein H310_13914 [Aphanomyces invadans]ETV91532.1 hypothetical protein H310_13914 [Aphanomyces invadans]|eukprot:XP_008879800.1 hypothetical protein H310_13914 [Aphanomyces invadans]